MKWPPEVVNGRIPFVEGAEATRILVIQTLSNLQTQPFNEQSLSLGDVTFRPATATVARIQSALRRLSSIISIDSIQERRSQGGTSVEYLIEYVDRETRIRQEVTING